MVSEVAEGVEDAASRETSDVFEWVFQQRLVLLNSLSRALICRSRVKFVFDQSGSGNAQSVCCGFSFVSCETTHGRMNLI